VINVREVQEVCESDEFEKSLEIYDFEENELALLLYTSGSTSTPKGVMLTTGCCHTFLRKNHQSMYRYDPDDRILCFVPFSHGFGSIFRPDSGIGVQGGNCVSKNIPSCQSCRSGDKREHYPYAGRADPLPSIV